MRGARKPLDFPDLIDLGAARGFNLNRLSLGPAPGPMQGRNRCVTVGLCQKAATKNGCGTVRSVRMMACGLNAARQTVCRACSAASLASAVRRRVSSIARSTISGGTSIAAGSAQPLKSIQKDDDITTALDRLRMIKTGCDHRPTDFINQIHYAATVATNYNKENADHPWDMSSETHVTFKMTF